ncbi:hypothetical protein SAMN05421594_2369 [Chryseobacterium oleae]|uniref:DoxX protein n=1 Tax=Chryseobacterium oleae TaxID=491207 RepID=A0A1I4YF04_CHROL|nr:hypothetical protein [Chryseobacterium oleae]SFN36618.1 hypothetical protein SAMN05421594_2369 [Chryseobacterium oleae]
MDNNNSINFPNQSKRNAVLRFLHLYVISYVYLFILTSQVSPLQGINKSGVLWLCKNIFQQHQLEYIKMTGSGDTTLDYWVVLVNMCLAAVAALVVLLTDKKQRTFKDLHWFTVVVARYYVAMIMLSYGFAKLHNGQFPANSIGRLEEKVGDMSPMGMIWSMMGASAGYTFVSGLLESMGGFLLLFRRTKTFGALFSMTVMINVALLNFFYDVPVKIFSSHIVLLCVFIVSGDAIALYRFFILHQPSQLRFQKRTSDKRWKRITLIGVKCLVIAFFIFSSSSMLFYTPPAVPMEGAYSVEKVVINNQEVPPCNNDSVGWKKLLISYSDRASVILNNDSTKAFQSMIDIGKKTLTLRKKERDNIYAYLHYNVQKDSIIFTGTIGRDSVKLKTTRKNKEDYKLNRRGFHWINEYPFNR